MSDTLTRMEVALVALQERTRGQRQPKAFYLGPDDWHDFMATDPPWVNVLFGNERVGNPAFKDVPVRPSKNVGPRSSRLYDNTGSGRAI